MGEIKGEMNQLGEFRTDEMAGLSFGKLVPSYGWAMRVRFSTLVSPAGSTRRVSLRVIIHCRRRLIRFWAKISVLPWPLELFSGVLLRTRMVFRAKSDIN